LPITKARTKRQTGAKAIHTHFYHACQYLQQLADTIFGAGAAAQRWAKEMRHVLKTKADGVARV
jgi:hypothetical protein